MRPGCSICADIFEYSDDSNVAALACGHTFHYPCITQWMETNGTKTTCPSCRTQIDRRKIVARLYFDDQGEGEEGDYGRVKNELDNVKLKLLQKDKEKNTLLTNVDHLTSKVCALEESKEGIKQALRTEQGTSKTLRQQVKLLQSQQNEAALSIKEAKQLRCQLRDLENVQKVITDSVSEIQETVQSYGSGEGAVKQMAMYIVTLKRELNKVKEERRSLRSENPKLKNAVQSMKHGVQQKDTEISRLREALTKTERELESKSLKISKLEKALGSPSNTAVGFAKRLLHESPAPSSFTPTLSRKTNGEIDLDDIDFVPCTPEIVQPSPNTQVKRECEDNDIQFVRFSKAGFNNAKRMKSESDVPPPMLNFNILKKKDNQTSILRTGYNGLGGHKNHVNLTQKSVFKAPVAKPKKSSALKPLNMKVSKGKDPALPSLKGFL